MDFIKHEDLKKCFKGYAMVSDRDDRFSVIAFSKDFGNTWEIRFAWIIPTDKADSYNKSLDPEDSLSLAYRKKDSWVFGNTYWEESFPTQTPELYTEMEALEAAKDELGIIEFLEEILKNCIICD